MLTFGDLRAAVHDVRGNPELVTDVVWALMHAPRAEYDRWFGYAMDNLTQPVSGYAHSLGELITFVMAGSDHLRAHVDARQRVLKDPRDRVNAHDLAVFLGGVAWCIVHGQGFPQLARPGLYVDFDRDGSISVSSAMTSGSFGVGMLVRDGGWPGVSDHLAEPFGGISIEVARQHSGRLDHDPGAAPGAEVIESPESFDPEGVVDPEWTRETARVLGVKNYANSMSKLVAQHTQHVDGPVHLLGATLATRGDLRCRHLSIFDSKLLVRGDLVVDGALELGPGARLVVLGDVTCAALDAFDSSELVVRGGAHADALLIEDVDTVRALELSCTLLFSTSESFEVPDPWDVELELARFDPDDAYVLPVWHDVGGYDYDGSRQRKILRACAYMPPGGLFDADFLAAHGIPVDHWPRPPLDGA